MKYEMTGRVRYSETDEQGRLSLGGLINYFQDCSTFHSEDLGLGISYLKARSQAWILSSWQIVPECMPQLGEEIRVHTWAYDFQGFYGLRNFTLTGAEGRVMVYANSVWVLFDVEKQRPVRIPAQEVERYEAQDPYPMEYASRKIVLPGKENVQVRTEMPIPVTHQLLDSNHHVNNGQYVILAARFLPQDWPIRQVRAEYRMQARLGDEMVPVVYTGAETTFVALCAAGNPAKAYAVVAFDGGLSTKDKTNDGVSNSR